MGVYSGSKPYGDIFQVPTNHIDRIADRIYREQQQRELEKRQNDKMLDDEFAKNVAGVKSVDIPEITQAYNNYKQSYVNLLKKGKKATPEEQMQVMRNRADAYSAIRASQEDKEYLKARATDGKNNKRYNPSYQLKINEYLNTPTSKRNRDNDDNDLLNKYAFPDLAKVTTNMLGKAVPKSIPTGKPSVEGKLYSDYEEYQMFNNPNQMYDNGFKEVGTRSDREAFERIVLDSLTDQEVNDLKTRYLLKVNSPEFKKIYGDVQPFPESAEKTDLGKAMAITVMGMVDKLPIAPVKINSKPNEEKKIELKDDLWNKHRDRTEGFAEKMEDTRHRHIKERQRLSTPQYQIDNVPGWLDNNEEEVETGGFFGSKKERLIPINKMPEAYKDDLFGKEKDKRGNPIKAPIVIKGKEYVRRLANGDFEIGDGKVILRKEIENNTIKRSNTLEKQIGTGKATIRDEKKTDKPKSKGKFDDL